MTKENRAAKESQAAEKSWDTKEEVQADPKTTIRPEMVKGRVLSATRALGRNPKTWQAGIVDCNQEKDVSN